ncbi:MAG: GNAT family N-acetyltransferase [Calditrichaeota bacterium]|nr:GNAT family N-acetyltransferase [Calditrichota bacterium]
MKRKAPLPPGLIIRNLRREDKVRLIELDAQLTGLRRDLYYDRKFRRFFGEDAPILLGLVAEAAGRLVGYILGEVNTGEYGIMQPVASVDTIGVDPQYKRTGVGRTLLEEYCAVAAKAGVETMTTLVSEDWPEVISFFKERGFHPAKLVAFERELPREGLFGRG